MRFAPMMGLMLVVGGCRGRRGSGGTTTAPPPPAPATAEPELRGNVVDGIYTDPTAGFSIPVPSGWTWKEGPTDATLQVKVVNPDQTLSIEVWRFSGTDYSLRPREGCPWTFEDRGSYSGPGGVQNRTIATCVPKDARSPRTFAWIVETATAAWQIEGHVAPDAILRTEPTLRWMVEGFTLDDAD